MEHVARTHGARAAAVHHCLKPAPAPKQHIACMRSFDQPINTQPPLIEAVSKFASRATEKLRHSNQRAGALLVFAHTLRPSHRFNKSTTTQLPLPTSDTTMLAGIRLIYEPGYRMAKAGVIVLDLTSAHPDAG